MPNVYEQDVILDADGKPVFDALKVVQVTIEKIQDVVAGIGKQTAEDAKAWAFQLGNNLKMLKQAQSDLRALQQQGKDRNQGFDNAEREAKQIASAEVRANKEANNQKLVEAKVYYGERTRMAQQASGVERDLAREIAQFEREQDRAAVASAREVAAARREAATAAVTGKARSITSYDDATAAKAASDLRLNQLRREREATASNDAAAARGIADRIAVERALGNALDTTINKLGRQAEAERKAAEAAEMRLRGQVPTAQRLLAPANVRDAVAASGDARSTLTGYQFEQELASRNLRATLADRDATGEQVVAARERLQLANANVAAAERLVRADEQDLEIQQRLLRVDRTEQTRQQMALANQYGRQQVETLGVKEATARAANAVAAAEEKLAGATGENIALAREELALAQARQKATGAAAEKTPLGNVLSPGYAVTAFARTALYGAAAGAAYGAFNTVQSSVSQVIQMEDELQKLQAIANATDPQLQQLKASIYDIGTTSRFSVIDLAKISQTLAQAGVSAGQMETVLKSVATLATASGSTPDEAVNLVTSALGSFQLQASEAGRVADLMTSALNRTKLTVQQTGQAIQYVGATAYEQNISLEQLLATIGAVAQAGVRSGSTIGTGFRQFLVDLQTPTEKLTEQLKAVGLTANDVNVSVKGLPAVLEKLRDSGFGSAQAYQGLETRAAAFYLVAKNNVDVMNDLQQSFAAQGAAAMANERAMNSLTAQWQRFKNILAEGLENSLGGFTTFIQNALTAISDHIEQVRKLRDQNDRDTANGTASIFQRNFAPDTEDIGRRSLNILGNYATLGAQGYRGEVSPLGYSNGGGLGDWLEGWTKKTGGLTAAQQRMATAVSDASDQVSTQANKISEVDKEMNTLLTQQEHLRTNSIDTTTATVTLSGKFEGLAKYLTNSKDKFGDLIQAMQQYRGEALKTQIAFLGSQRSLYGQQADTAKNLATGLANQALNNPGLMAQLTPREREALRQPRVGANAQVIADAGERLHNDTLRDLSQRLGDLAIAVANQNSATALQTDATMQNTAAGRSLEQRTKNAEAGLTGFTSMSQSDQVKAAPALRAMAQGVVTEVKNRLANPDTAKDAIPTLQGYLQRSESVLKGIQAGLDPTKKELQEQKREERDAEHQAKLVTQSDIDAVGQALGLKLGSGTRSVKEQTDLFNRGVTRADAAHSDHVVTNGLARDFRLRGVSDADAERIATTLREQYRQKGINAQVKFEHGGPKDGTGRHIHVGVRKGTTRRSDNSDTASDKFDLQNEQAGLALDEEDLKTKLKDVARTTTTETFNSAVATARQALDKVNGELLGIAKDELANAGIAKGSAQGQAKIKQVQEQIAQNTADFNQKIADAILKSLDKQIKAAQTAFEQAVQPSQAGLKIAQDQLSGLDAYSLRNKVPDYVKTLASDRVAQAQENVTRAQDAALPAQIAAQQAAIAAAKTAADTQGVTPDTTAHIAELNVQLQQLIANKEALDSQLNAGGLVPSTIAQGLDQAIQAYRQANDLGKTFAQEITMNLGGAISQVSDGLGTMFGNILTGSQTALQAFGTFAKGIMQYIQQIVAKIIATKIVDLLLNLASSFLGGKAVGGGNGASVGDAGTIVTGSGNAVVPFAPVGNFQGGEIGRDRGGEVDNGTPAMDSVRTRLARGEWVIQKPAVDSVGRQFMANLNQHGAKALSSLQSMPQIDMKSHTETNVYVVKPEDKPTLGPNDVRVILNDDLLNGESGKLVQHISRDSR